MNSGIVDVAEQKRLNEAREARIPWKKWGPYLSERQWGTVREDYSEDGNAWNYFYARPVALARLQVGRGRARRHCATTSNGCALRWRCGTVAIRS